MRLRTKLYIKLYTCQIIGMAYCNIADIAVLNKLEQNVEPAAKALAVSEPMAI